MDTIEFDESGLEDLQSVGQRLFQDADDPRSVYYRRILNRPRIRWGRVAVCALLPTALCVCGAVGLTALGVKRWLAWLLALLALLIWAAANGKRAAVCVVRIYQRLAPEGMRNKCRFEPSCSEYMILALEKYGLLRGLKMGLRRLGRCNIRGGGFDYP